MPILRDLPLVKELNLELGGRYSDYSTSGGVSTYKILADWAITDWARLRGGFNKATRAPNLAEQFLGKSQVTVTLSDPCSQGQTGAAASYSANAAAAANPAGAAQVLALCQSLMTQAASDVYYGVIASSQPSTATTTSFLVGSPTVQPESADTWTAGLVLRAPFENPWIAGLGATIDWYSIQITDIISQQSINDVWKACIVSGAASSAQCSVVGRDPFDGRPCRAVTALLQQRGPDPLQRCGRGAQLARTACRPRAASRAGCSVVQHAADDSHEAQHLLGGDRRVDGVHKHTTGCASGVVCSGYKYQAFTTLGYSTGPLALSPALELLPDHQGGRCGNESGHPHARHLRVVQPAVIVRFV